MDVAYSCKHEEEMELDEIGINIKMRVPAIPLLLLLLCIRS